MITILEYIWWRDRMTVLRLLGLGLLEEKAVEKVVGETLSRVEDELKPRQYERMMRHDAYHRGRGGALRQVRWG